MNAAEIATGAPKPAAPSMKAPNEKAMMSACRRRSAEIAAIESFMISKAPLARDTGMPKVRMARKDIRARLSSQNDSGRWDLAPPADRETVSHQVHREHDPEDE